MAEAGSNIDWKNAAIGLGITGLLIGTAIGAMALGRTWVNYQDKKAAKKKQAQQTASSK